MRISLKYDESGGIHGRIGLVFLTNRAAKYDESGRRDRWWLIHDAPAAANSDKLGGLAAGGMKVV